jgi:hypothetical protein
MCLRIIHRGPKRKDPQPRKQYIVRGERVPNEMPWSEVCMHMRVAGLVLDVEIIGEQYPMAQLYRDGQPFSAPITLGEAGIHQDIDGFYITVWEVA